MPSPGRNDLCPCGSGKKFKRCCGSAGPAPGVTRDPSREAIELIQIANSPDREEGIGERHLVAVDGDLGLHGRRCGSQGSPFT